MGIVAGFRRGRIPFLANDCANLAECGRLSYDGGMKQETRWTLLILFAFLVWGSFFPISRYIVADIHPLLLAFLRYLFAVVPLLPFFLVELGRSGAPSARDAGGLFLLGMLGVTGFAVFLFYGIKLSNSMLASILNNTQPIFTTLLAPIFTSERFTGRQLRGILLGLAGMAVVVTGGDFGSLASGDSMLTGNIFSLLSAICISLYYILLKKKIMRYGSVVPTFITFLSGGSILLVLALLSGADFGSLAELGPLEWVMLAYNGAVATALVYIIHNRAISVIGVIRTVRMKFLIPVFGVLLSIIFLGERAGAYVWAGMAVVIAAAWLLQLPDGKRGDPGPL